jgi:hypothetical protein
LELCSVGCAFTAQNSSKIHATNIDLTDAEGVATKVQFPNPCTEAANPFALGSLLKVFALNFRGESAFSHSLFSRLRMRWIGRDNDYKTRGDDARNELAPPHSITSSALASSEGGMVMQALLCEPVAPSDRVSAPPLP